MFTTAQIIRRKQLQLSTTTRYTHNHKVHPLYTYEAGSRSQKHNTALAEFAHVTKCAYY